MTLCPGFKSLPALVSSTPLPADSLLPKPHTKGLLDHWVQVELEKWPGSPQFSISLHVLPLSIFLPLSVYLLFPADAKTGLVNKGSGLTLVLWANITPQQVWRR